MFILKEIQQVCYPYNEIVYNENDEPEYFYMI